ncbi:hypothetical protein B0H16DRAFT_1724127 [Mycena metata]|uniref:Uncharacterized protein n=1 Tax=Mycena metata TaxID=1033252 RepID=A0AAD7NAD8_9AGAR|nr:hypothetical protein B0H16DRAFT_1724127 [Mycena metata]
MLSTYSGIWGGLRTLLVSTASALASTRRALTVPQTRTSPSYLLCAADEMRRVEARRYHLASYPQPTDSRPCRLTPPRPAARLAPATATRAPHPGCGCGVTAFVFIVAASIPGVGMGMARGGNEDTGYS